MPVVFVSIGLKLPTGEHDAFDNDKYLFDRSKALTGELSISDGILPSRYQLGTGTFDPLLGLFYSQRFWRITATGSMSVVVSGGENSVGYERGSKLSFATGARMALLRSGKDAEISASLGFSGVVGLNKDVDHAEDTTLLLRQEKGPVDGTDLSFYFADIGLSGSFFDLFSAGLTVRLPLSDSSGSDEDSFVMQVSFNFSVRF